MKHKIQFSFQVILLLAICMIGNSCAKSEENSIQDQFKGSLKLHVDLSILVNGTNYETKSQQMKSETSDDDFQVQVFKKDEETPTMTFEHSTEIPDLITLNEGDYYVTASCGENPDAAFNSPYYSGESEVFTIINGQTTSANVTCTLANIMVTVVYSDQVIADFDECTTTVSNAAASLTFIKDDDRTGFFNAGPLMIECQLNYTSGGESKVKTLTKSIDNPQPGKHYEIHIDTTPDEGDFDIPIAIDPTVETIVVDLTDEENPESPGDVGSGELLITEIMYNPSALGDTEGEWIEVFNNSSEMINLKDLVIRKGGATNFYQITEDIELASGAYAVLARKITATANVDYVYGSLSLGNDGDNLIISTFGTDGTDGSVICSVDYSAEGFDTKLDGKSLQLDPSVRDVNDARLGSNWCAATLTYSTGDYGTPGLENSACE